MKLASDFNYPLYDMEIKLLFKQKKNGNETISD